MLNQTVQSMLNDDTAQSSKIMSRIGDAAPKVWIFSKKFTAVYESKSSMDEAMVGTLVSRTGSTGSRQASTSSQDHDPNKAILR